MLLRGSAHLVPEAVARALDGAQRQLVGMLQSSVALARNQLQAPELEVERVLLTDSVLEQEIRARHLSTASCRGCGAGLQDEWIDCPYCLTPRGTLQE